MKQFIFAFLDPIQQSTYQVYTVGSIDQRFENDVQLEAFGVPGQNGFVRCPLEHQLQRTSVTMQPLVGPFIQLYQMFSRKRVGGAQTGLVELRRRFALVQVMPDFRKAGTQAGLAVGVQGFVDGLQTIGSA